MALSDSNAVGRSPASAVPAARVVAGRAGAPLVPPSPGPVQTVGLMGDWLERGVSSRMLRAAARPSPSSIGRIGTATGPLAATPFLGLPLVPTAAAGAGRAS